MDWNSTAFQACLCAWNPLATSDQCGDANGGCAPFTDDLVPVAAASVVPLVAIIVVMLLVSLRKVYQCAIGQEWSPDTAKGIAATEQPTPSNGLFRLALVLLALYVAGGFLTSHWADRVYSRTRAVTALITNETVIAKTMSAGFADSMAAVVGQLHAAEQLIITAENVSGVVASEVTRVDDHATRVVNNWSVTNALLWSPCIVMFLVVVALFMRTKSYVYIGLLLLLTLASVGIFTFQAAATLSGVVLSDACDDYDGLVQMGAGHFAAAFPDVQRDMSSAKEVYVNVSCGTRGGVSEFTKADTMPLQALCRDFFDCDTDAQSACRNSSYDGVAAIITKSVRRGDGADNDGWGACGAICTMEACSTQCKFGSMLQMSTAHLVKTRNAMRIGVSDADAVASTLGDATFFTDLMAAAQGSLCGASSTAHNTLVYELRYLACLCGFACLLTFSAVLLTAFASLLPPPPTTYYTLLGDGEFPSPQHQVSRKGISRLPVGVDPEAEEGSSDDEDDPDHGVVIGGLLKIGEPKWVASKWAD